MSIAEIIKAWKDEEYRNSLSPEQLQNLPENPVGLTELEEHEIQVTGGNWATFGSYCPIGGGGSSG